MAGHHAYLQHAHNTHTHTHTHTVQVILVSATLPHDILEMTHKFMSEPIRILVKR